MIALLGYFAIVFSDRHHTIKLFDVAMASLGNKKLHYYYPHYNYNYDHVVMVMHACIDIIIYSVGNDNV